MSWVLGPESRVSGWDGGDCSGRSPIYPTSVGWAYPIHVTTPVEQDTYRENALLCKTAAERSSREDYCQIPQNFLRWKFDVVHWPWVFVKIFNRQRFSERDTVEKPHKFARNWSDSVSITQPFTGWARRKHKWVNGYLLTPFVVHFCFLYIGPIPT